MKHVQFIAATILMLAPLTAVASDDRASALAEKQLWDYAEKIAFALPAGGRAVSALVSGSGRPGEAFADERTPASVAGIGPSLSAFNIAVVLGEQGRADSVSFDLKGRCVPLQSLRARYPHLLVLDQARDATPHARYTLGARVGEAIIGYSFPADHLGCMSHVDVSLAPREAAL